MMKIVSISDIHGRLREIDLVKPWLDEADAVVLAGDITNFGHAGDARGIVELIQSHCSRLLAVSGNCDYPDVSRALADWGISLETGPVVLEGLAFLGLGGSLPGPGSTPNEFSEGELESALARAAADLPDDRPFILVSHQPPRNTAADRTFRGLHVGSTAVRDFIQAHQPLVCFTAHIHESMGMSQIGSTRVVNPGPLSRGNVAIASLDGHALVDCRIQPLSQRGTPP
jgi:Icc-related predicted phosphoesterase